MNYIYKAAVGFSKKKVRRYAVFIAMALCTQTCILYSDISPIPPPSPASAFDCKRCKYVIKEGDETIDGKALNIQPGDFICLSASVKHATHLRFINIVGQLAQPIIITNCDGPVEHQVAASELFNLKFERSQYFGVKGFGNRGEQPLKFSGATLGLSMDNLSTDFEIENVEVYNVGFAGIMAKTDPSCDSTTIRGNFTLRNASFHDNFVHNIGGEGFYIGNSFYANGVNLLCGVRFPHELENIKIYGNHVTNTGRESIQLGCAVRGAEIYNNLAENYGTAGLSGQTNGIQVGEGTGGLCFNNTVISGEGTGIIVLGWGDNLIFNNLIVDAKGYGIFCDKRVTPGDGFKFINNTIINPQQDGIRIYANGDSLRSLRNVVVNNLIVSPGTYNSYSSPRSYKDSYVYLKDTSVHALQANNVFSQHIENVHFIDPENMNFYLKKNSKAVNAGRDVSCFGIYFDYCYNRRPLGSSVDAGAFEYDSAISSSVVIPCGLALRSRTR